MLGILYGVSVGSGDPELMTLKAVRIISDCEIIAVPQTKGENTLALSIAEKICSFEGKIIIRLEFLMSKNKDELRISHERNGEILSHYLDEGKSVAFLNIGDISIYSTFSYIAEIIQRKGYTYEICPGVTSFCAAAAALKIPLVQGDESLTVFSPSSPDADELYEGCGTKVIMKSGRVISSIKEKIRNMNAYAVENCGLEKEKLFYSADDLKDDGGYFTTIIIR